VQDFTVRRTDTVRKALHVLYTFEGVMTTDNSIMSWSGLKSLERVKIDWQITGDGIEGEQGRDLLRI
jgi:hypothetical protein